MSHRSTGRSDGRRKRCGRRIGASVVAGSLLIGALLFAGPALATPRNGTVSAGRTTQSYSFAKPDAIAVAGDVLFVANRAGNSITEVNASSGAFLTRLSNARYAFNEPSALLVVGKNVFVANEHAGVTELTAANGALVRIMQGLGYHFSDPIALAADSTGHLFVLSANGVVTKISTGTGKPIAVASGRSFDFKVPTAIASVGQDLFVTNRAGNSVTEINADTMRVVRILVSKAYAFDEPTGIAVHGHNVWVTNYSGQSITEFSAVTSFRQVLYSANYDYYLSAPGPITYGDGSFIAVNPPGGSPMVTRIIPGTRVTMTWWECNTNQPTPQLSNPQSVVVAGGGVWLASEGSAIFPGGSLTKLSILTGNTLKVVANVPT